MAKKAKVSVNPNFQIGEISPRLYSAFLEPIGTMVNGCLYNPTHPTADEQGFRTDWIEGLKTTDLPAVRLPGGNFVSGWDWKDSIGPKDQRKTHLDLAWYQYYTNEVGHDEYLQWAEKVGVEPLYTINLGTGDINDAISILEYTNHEGGTFWSDLRKKNGHEKPYNVKFWYLGNEMDGPWQIASWEKDPKGYGVLAHEVAKAMKYVDGDIETAVCVSCSPDQPHFPEWDLEVLKECYHMVDYVSMHHYQGADIGNYAQFMAASRYFEDYIRTEIAVCDYVQELLRSPKVMMLSFDEYAVMSRPAKPLTIGREIYCAADVFYPKKGYKEYQHRDPEHMFDNPRRMPGDADPMLTPLGNAAVLMELLRHADRVKVGCMTFGLNTACACDKDHVWRSAAYYTYADLMRYGQGISLKTAVDCEKYDLAGFALDDTSRYHEQNDVELIDSAAAYNEEKGELTVFVINRDWEDTADFTLKVSELDGYHFEGHYEMYTEERGIENTYENPNALVPHKNEAATCDGNVVKAELKKISWNVFRFVKD